MITYPYDKNSGDIHTTMLKALRTYREDLVELGVKVDTLAVANHDADDQPIDAIKVNKCGVAARIAVVSHKHRSLGNGDALIEVDAYRWSNMTERQQLAAMDNLLIRLELHEDEDGVMTDERGRPKLTLRLPDWTLEGFREVAARHGEDSLEVRECRSVLVEFGDVIQPPIESFAGSTTVGQIAPTPTTEQ